MTCSKPTKWLTNFLDLFKVNKMINCSSKCISKAFVLKIHLICFIKCIFTLVLWGYEEKLKFVKEEILNRKKKHTKTQINNFFPLITFLCTKKMLLFLFNIRLFLFWLIFARFVLQKFFLKIFEFALIVSFTILLQTVNIVFFKKHSNHLKQFN